MCFVCHCHDWQPIKHHLIGLGDCEQVEWNSTLLNQKLCMQACRQKRKLCTKAESQPASITPQAIPQAEAEAVAAAGAGIRSRDCAHKQVHQKRDLHRKHNLPESITCTRSTTCPRSCALQAGSAPVTRHHKQYHKQQAEAEAVIEAKAGIRSRNCAPEA